MEISLVTVIWSMIASACLTLAGIQLLVWCKTRNAWPNLLFSLTAVSTAAFAFCELRMMRASTPAEFASTLKWGQVPVWLLVVSLVGFVRLVLKAGRPSLAWTVCGLRTFALLLDFSVGQNLNYREITRLRHIPFLGESVQIAEGVPNPWMLVGQLSLMVLLIFAADASATAWRRGDRQKAITVGGSIVFFTLVSTGQSVLVFWGIVQAPIVASISFMGLVAVMGYELSREAVRASQLDRKLQVSEAELHENEERMRLAVEACRFWYLDSRSRAKRNLGDRQMADVVRLLKDGTAGIRKHPAATSSGRSRCVPLSARERDSGRRQLRSGISSSAPEGPDALDQFSRPRRTRRRRQTNSRTWRLARYYGAKGSGAGDTEFAAGDCACGPRFDAGPAGVGVGA